MSEGITPNQLTLDCIPFRKVITHAELLAFSGDPIVIVPATETLNYEGTPTRIPVPTLVFFTSNTLGGAYTNVDGGAQLVLALGSDWSADFLQVTHSAAGSPFSSPAIRLFQAASIYSMSTLPANPDTPHYHNLTCCGMGLNDNLQDNALILAFNNGSLGALQDGHASNTLTIEGYYTNFQL